MEEREFHFTVTPLDLGATLKCGQAFRWNEEEDGTFTGVVSKAVVNAAQVGETLCIRISTKMCTPSDVVLTEDFWKNYFAVDVDYDGLHSLYRRNKNLGKCVDYAPGIRVLRQDFYETLISFIISQNNNITRIGSIIKKLSSLYGEEVGESKCGEKLYSFPEASVLSKLSVEDLAPLRAGYRTPSIIGGAKLVSSVFFEEAKLMEMSLQDARELLMEAKGVGPKIADCVLLFGLGRFDAFPVDVWMRRAMSTLFPDGLPKYVLPSAGIAQQYIFHYMRNANG